MRVDRQLSPDGVCFREVSLYVHLWALGNNCGKCVIMELPCCTTYRSSICQEIVGCRGDGVEHSLRVTVYKYPEDVVAVWVMLAVKYRSVV